MYRNLATFASSAPPGQLHKSMHLSTGYARAARASPVATTRRPVGARAWSHGWC